MTYREIEMHAEAIARMNERLQEFHRPLTIGERALFLAGLVIFLGAMALVAHFAPTVFFAGILVGALIPPSYP